MQQLYQLLLSFTQPRHMRTLIGRYGVARTTLLLSGVGFLVSLAIMAPINFLTHGSLFTGLVVSAVICCTVLPLHLYQLGHLLADLERAHQALYVVATRDELTQAYNRRYFMEQLRLLCHTQPYTAGCAVLLLDIDNFKSINDTFGHDAGDLILRQLSQLCCANLRATDLFARYGGEEFAFLLLQTSPQSAVDFAERIRCLIAQALFVYNRAPMGCTVSIGVSAANPLRTTPDVLLTTADQALYAAKHHGKNQVMLYGRQEQVRAQALPTYLEHTTLTGLSTPELSAPQPLSLPAL